MVTFLNQTEQAVILSPQDFSFQSWEIIQAASPGAVSSKACLSSGNFCGLGEVRSPLQSHGLLQAPSKSHISCQNNLHPLHIFLSSSTEVK